MLKSILFVSAMSLSTLAIAGTCHFVDNKMCTDKTQILDRVAFSEAIKKESTVIKEYINNVCSSDLSCTHSVLNYLISNKKLNKTNYILELDGVESCVSAYSAGNGYVLMNSHVYTDETEYLYSKNHSYIKQNYSKMGKTNKCNSSTKLLKGI